MQPLEQNFSQSKIGQCSFCYNPTQEIKLILQSCVIQIASMLGLKKYRQYTRTDLIKCEGSNISRLIRILFDKQQFQIIYSKGCSHLALQSLLRQKLKCNNDHLEFLIDQLCDKLARRNYQLQIISLQVKNVQNSVFQLEDQPQIELKRLKQSQSSQSEENKGESSQQAVKVEQGHKLLSVSPPTALNYSNITFDNIPMGYNILFYGGAYYQ